MRLISLLCLNKVFVTTSVILSIIHIDFIVIICFIYFFLTLFCFLSYNQAALEVNVYTEPSFQSTTSSVLKQGIPLIAFSPKHFLGATITALETVPGWIKFNQVFILKSEHNQLFSQGWVPILSQKYEVYLSQIDSVEYPAASVDKKTHDIITNGLYQAYYSFEPKHWFVLASCRCVRSRDRSFLKFLP